MIVINKSVHGHNSLGMINKVMEITQTQTPSVPQMTSLPKTSDMVSYKREYKKLGAHTPPKRRDFHLSYASFENKNDYVRALKEAHNHADNESLRTFIKENVNGGFSYDESCVLI